MVRNTHIFLFGLIVIVVLMSFIPYTSEKFEMDINLDRMSCLDFLQRSPSLRSIYDGVTGSGNRREVVQDMERAVIPMYSADGVVYNDSEYCVLRQDKLRSYNMDESCRLGNYGLIRSDNTNYDPAGCVINPRDPWFLSFLDEGYNVKNRDDISRINELNTALSDIDSRSRNLNNTINTISSQLNTSISEANNLRGENSSLRSQLDAALRTNSDLINNQMNLGRTANNPAVSARQIQNQSGNNAGDGVYYISCGGVAKPIYCIMDTNYDGGGWMLLMKMGPGTTFHFTSSYWTSANTLNENSTDLGPTDAKFQVFNTNNIVDVMAIYPRADHSLTGGSIRNQNKGWTWLVRSWYNGGQPITALAGFQQARDASPADPYHFNGWTPRIWSSQEPARRFVFGGHSHLGRGWSGQGNDWGSVRWGFVFNENGANDFRSNDVWGGIGGGNRYGGNVHGWGGNQYFSAGDYFGCCGRAGINRRISALLFGR